MNKARGMSSLLGLLMMPVSLTLLFISLSSGGGLIGAPLSITLLLVANVIFLAHDISRNVVFIVFQATYFLFLIAGPLLDAFDGVDFFRTFSSSTVSRTYTCYWLAAFAMWCYCLHRSNGGRELVIGLGRRRDTQKDLNHRYDLARIRSISKILFYICIVAYIAVTADKILFRQIYSLQAYYATYDVSSNLPGIIVKISDCHLIALCMFLATKPTKKEAKAPLIVFLGASALTVLYGVRHVIMLNIMFLVIYFVLRNGDGDEVWLPKRTAIVGIILSPVAMVLLQAFDVFRRSIAFNILDVRELFSFSLVRDFFVSQSVSSNILPNAITHFSQLGGQPVPYTFGTIYTYLRQNMIVRFFTGAAAFSSNSVEAAMSSGNLGARLAYYMYRETFLTGTGMGGSYVADLFVDFSYIGVFVGGLIACMIINKLSKSTRGGYNSPYILAFVLVAIRWIAYMPRDSYFSWAMQAFSFMNIIFVLMVMVLSRTKMPGRATNVMADS